MTQLLAVAGILSFLLLGYLCSIDRRAISWKTVVWGLILQFLFAVSVLKFSVGAKILSLVAQSVTGLISYADRGGEFVFGWLVTDPDPNRFVFAFKVLPIVIFISSLSSCLYYLGILQWFVAIMARIMRKFMGVSGAESLGAAANVFMGQTEAPILVAPYVPQMTLSELMALMTGGMATVSGAVLGGYIGLGINPEYLISASLMAAPASLLMAKIVVPETERPKTTGGVRLEVSKEGVNLIDVAARGAGRGATLAINIAAMLVAFIAIIFFLNGLLGTVGAWAGFDRLAGTSLSIELLLSYLLAPLAFLMGVPFEDILDVGRLIGTKIVLNEFVAYIDLVALELQPKSELIATYALCGFANFGSIGIQIGGIGGLAPERRSDLAKLGLRAVLAGSLASFMTATIAGVLI